MNAIGELPGVDVSARADAVVGRAGRRAAEKRRAIGYRVPRDGCDLGGICWNGFVSNVYGIIIV